MPLEQNMGDITCHVDSARTPHERILLYSQEKIYDQARCYPKTQPNTPIQWTGGIGAILEHLEAK